MEMKTDNKKTLAVIEETAKKFTLFNCSPGVFVYSMCVYTHTHTLIILSVAITIFLTKIKYFTLRMAPK